MRLMAGREDFVIDTNALADDERAEAVRFVLQLLDAKASAFESDVPLANQDGWPEDVVEAAAVLCSARPPRRGENDKYRRTGVQQRSAEPVWQAFTRFAPYAYDARVWDAPGATLIALADQGTSCVARLSEEEARLISSRHTVPVVRLDEWRAAER